MGKKSLKNTVKDTIDFVYEILTSNPQGYELNVRKTMRFREARVCAILVKRGIISKRFTTGPERKCVYTWVAPMQPTKVLYGSVSDELYNMERTRRVVTKKEEPTLDSNVTISGVPNDESNVELEDTTCKTLKSATEQELWDELKRRGARGKIRIVKEIELT